MVKKVKHQYIRLYLQNLYQHHICLIELDLTIYEPYWKCTEVVMMWGEAVCLFVKLPRCLICGLQTKAFLLCKCIISDFPCSFFLVFTGYFFYFSRTLKINYTGFRSLTYKSLQRYSSCLICSQHCHALQCLLTHNSWDLMSQHKGFTLSVHKW